MDTNQLSAVYKKETSKGQRENRFEQPVENSRRKNETLRLKREAHLRELEEIKALNQPANMIQADYKTRGLDFCYYCGEKFNVGEKIPRILIHCGHTFCTECLSVLHHNFRVRCPICRKLVKQVESVDKLPLNFNILYEIVERDYILRDINFEDEDCIECLLCDKHDQRVQHFYCSNHLTVFCRECIKEDHTDERCFVVDLYEIEKMRKMHRLNQQSNKKQLEKRKDDADSSCVSQDIPLNQIMGDSKWFVKRRAKQLEQQQEQQKQQMLLMKQNQAAMLANNNNATPDQDESAMKAMRQMFSGLKNVDFSKLTPEQNEQLIMAATAQGGDALQAQQLIMAAQQKNQALLLADQDGSDDEDCIDDDDDNSSDENFDLEDGEIEVIKEGKAKGIKKVFPDVDDDDDCEGPDDSGDYDDDEEMDDESLEDYNDQDDDSDKMKAKKEEGAKEKNSSDDDDTPKQVIPLDNAQTKLQDEAIEAQLLAEALGKNPMDEEEEPEKVEEPAKDTAVKTE